MAGSSYRAGTVPDVLARDSQFDILLEILEQLRGLGWRPMDHPDWNHTLFAPTGKELVRQYIETVWNQGDLEAIDNLVADTYVRYNDLLPTGQLAGRDALERLIAKERRAFPDLRLTIEDLVAEGDVIAARLIAQATHRGNLMTIPPTGKQFRSQDSRFFRIAGGKIVEEHVTANVLHILQQLGLVPPLGQLLGGNSSNR